VIEVEVQLIKPRVYVHRLGEWYTLYMNRQNEAALAAFADVVSEGSRETPLSEAELIERMRGCKAVLSLNGVGAGEITADVLRRVGVKVICVSHWWGQFAESSAAAGVLLTEGSNANTIAVAEWTVAAALMGIRKLSEFDRTLKAGSLWAEPRRNIGLLCESIVGLVGLGRVGRFALKYFKALGAKVVAYDKYLSEAEARTLGVQLMELDELLRTADVISLHLPVTPETQGLLSAREFALIKNGAVFINSARAALYDEKALVQELRQERFCAYFDVFAVEPLALDHPFRSMDNVVITPHIAGDNGAMFVRCGREAIETLKAYFAGEGLRSMRY
jgi:phosphoglycerate dehydrogenase-like enzyme